MYSKKQKTTLLIMLIVAIIGLINFYIIDGDIFGLTSKQLAILSFFPLSLALYLIFNYDKLR